MEHQPVLSDEVRALVKPAPGEVVLDATSGHGGHASLLAAEIGPAGTLIGLDVDPANLSRARARVESSTPVSLRPACHWVRANFRELAAVLSSLNVQGVDVILADLGPSTDQLLDPQRGLTFQEDGPLDMRLDDRLPTSAMDLVNSLSEQQLADLFWQLSQERFSRKISQKIVQARRAGRIQRTRELVRIVCSALGVPESSRRHRIHPATRVCLALRMAVNHELENLTGLLAQAPRRLLPNGRFAVISFHSGEDRLVKKSFVEASRSGLYTILTKKPVQASAEEERRNPRSRSAKLRVAMRTALPVEGA